MNHSTLSRRTLTGAFGALFLLLSASNASASGLHLDDSNGRNTSTLDDAPLALFHTPSSLRLAPGSALQVDLTGLGILTTYTRDTSARAGGEVHERDAQVAGALMPSLALKRQLSDTGITFGVALSSPVWEKSRWGDGGGEHRWHAIDSSTRAFQVAPALSYTLPGSRLHLGASVTAMRVKHSQYKAFDWGAQIASAQEVDDVPAEAEGNEGRVYRELAGNTATASGSLTYQMSDTLLLAASYTSAATLTLTGDVEYYAPKNDAFQDRVGDQTKTGSLELRLPHMFRVGALMGDVSDATFGVDVQFSSWFLQDVYCLEVGDLQVAGNPSERIRSEWRPSGALRLRGSKALEGGARIKGLAGFTSSAIPDDVVALDMFDAHRVTLGAAYSFMATETLRAEVGYTHLAALPVNVEESSRSPAANGEYGQQAGTLHVTFQRDFAPPGPRPGALPEGGE